MTARTVFPYVHTWLCLICRSIVSADTPSCLLWHAVNDTWRFPRQHTSLFPARLKFFKLQVSAGRHTMRAASPTSSAAQLATTWQSLQEATSSSHGPPGRPTGSHTTAPRGCPRHLACAIFFAGSACTAVGMLEGPARRIAASPHRCGWLSHLPVGSLKCWSWCRLPQGKAGAEHGMDAQQHPMAGHTRGRCLSEL